MTEHYLGGHEQPWQEIRTGITLPVRSNIG
jgi:hypothetical protein